MSLNLSLPHLRDYHLKCSCYRGKFDGKFIMCIYFFISFPHTLKFIFYQSLVILYQSLVMFGESGRKLNCGWITYFTGGGGGGGGLGFCRTIRMIFVGCRDGRSFTSRDPGKTCIFGRTMLICRTCKQDKLKCIISHTLLLAVLKPVYTWRFLVPVRYYHR